MLNAAFEATGPDAVALRWSCDDPAPALEALRRFGWIGAAVTMPHKQKVRDLLLAEGRLGPTAVEVGAVNTVVNEGGTLVGHNTDLGGLLDALAPHLPPEGVAGKTFLVIGAGGAARAAVAAARRLGARPVVLARRREQAEKLGAEVASDGADAAARAPAVVVAAVPRDVTPPMRLEASGSFRIDPKAIPGRAVVLDMPVAAPWTPSLYLFSLAGHRAVPGFDMLLAQAAHQVVLLGGPAPDRARMAAIGGAALSRRDCPIVLTGLRCAGKSTVAPLLADLLGRLSSDSDALIESHLEAGNALNRDVRRTVDPDAPPATEWTIDDLLRAGAEPLVRQVEALQLRLVGALPTPTVTALGGGAALHSTEFAAVAARSAVVLLDAPDDVLLARRAASPRVPLTNLPPSEELARQRAARMPVYRAAAALTVDVSTLDPEAAAERIAAWWDEVSASDLPSDRSETP